MPLQESLGGEGGSLVGVRQGGLRSVQLAPSKALAASSSEYTWDQGLLRSPSEALISGRPVRAPGELLALSLRRALQHAAALDLLISSTGICDTSAVDGSSWLLPGVCWSPSGWEAVESLGSNSLLLVSAFFSSMALRLLLLLLH